MTIPSIGYEARMVGFKKTADKNGDWVEVPEHPNYEINLQGVVRRATKGKGTYPGRVVKQQISKRGYYTVMLSTARRPVHRLLFLAFGGPPPDGKPNICHKDGDRLNNALSNLYWGDQRNNLQDASRHGMLKGRNTPRGSKHGMSKITEKIAKDIRERYIKRKNGKQLAKEYNLTVTTIVEIASGKTWKNV